MVNLKGSIDAFADALRRAEAHHKAHLEAHGGNTIWKENDWVEYYAQFLAREFAGVRIPLNVDVETLPHATVPDATGDSTAFNIDSPEEGVGRPVAVSNRKWEPETREDPCYGPLCRE